MKYLERSLEWWGSSILGEVDVVNQVVNALY